MKLEKRLKIIILEYFPLLLLLHYISGEGGFVGHFLPQYIDFIWQMILLPSKMKVIDCFY